jgi:pimeloyl-ACP methyl ester carboxylesterase
MTSFYNGDVEIAYFDAGQDQPNAEPIVLVHGFASNKEYNWVNPSWVGTLSGAGRRVIALDNRGHGASGKLYDPAAYEMALMAGDVRALLDHLRIARADVMGYSMGARIAAVLAVHHPERVRSLIIGGLGIRLVEGDDTGLAPRIVGALEAPSLADVTDPTGRSFRRFAEQTGSDRKALAACMRRPRTMLSREQVAGIKAPVLVAVGTKDDVSGSGAELAALIPGARLLEIPDRDHMVAVGDKVFKAGVLDFLNQRP